jgi:hypothetical protein
MLQPVPSSEIAARAYRCPARLESQATGHWHYVTYGLSEPYVPLPEADPSVSGWGFELTMRVAREAGSTVPQWPFSVLNQIARHINRTGVPLDPGHRLDVHAPVTGYPHIDGAPDTNPTVLAVLTDPELGEISTPNGKVSFLPVRRRHGTGERADGRIIHRRRAERTCPWQPAADHRPQPGAERSRPPSVA